MKKMLMFVASVAMAVVLTGCGCSKSSDEEQKKDGLDSSKGVAESFVNAIIQKDADKAFACIDATDTTVFTPEAIRKTKELVEKLGRDINDDKLDATTVREEIDVPSEMQGYKILNGKKYTGERATVRVQFVKGKDKKSKGMTIKLVKVDGSWKVEMADYRIEDGFDTSDDDSESDRDSKEKVDVPKARKNDRDREFDMDRKDMDAVVPMTNRVAVSKVAESKKDYYGKAESKYDGKYEKVRKFEGLCQEAASLMGLSREDVENEVKKFKNASEEEQEKALEMAENALKDMRRNADKKAEGKSYKDAAKDAKKAAW